MKLSIVIPAYNESVNFQKGKLNQIDQYLTDKKLSWQIIVVDDGSTDGSFKEIAQFVKHRPYWQLIKNPHQGKAAAIKTGVLKAKYPYILFTDFDQATPISEVEKLLPFLSKGYQIVIGSREVKGSLREKEPFLRHLMGKVFNFMVQLIAVGGIHDTQCGFKIFKTAVAKDLFNSLKIYQPKAEKYAFTGAFDVELLFLANKRHLKIAEVPISWYHVPTDRVNPLRDSWRMLIDVLKIRWTDIAGQYH